MEVGDGTGAQYCIGQMLIENCYLVAEKRRGGDPTDPRKNI